MYQMNDTVLYSSHGVCRIEDIVVKDFGGEKKEYYLLKPLNSESSSIYLPVDNQRLVEKMRKVLSASEINELIHSMPHEDSAWIPDETLRKERYREMLTKGDPRELIRMIKALYIHQEEQRAKGKKFHIADEHFFKEAEKLLYEEFAYVLKIRLDQVLPFIMEKVRLEEREQ